MPQRVQKRADFSEYPRWYRYVEIGSIAALFFLVGALFIRLSGPVRDYPWLILAAAVSAYLFADFVSGCVHWMADTWGSTDLGVIGKALVRPFREHHVDQLAIVRHDFVETNGTNCLICLPLAIGTQFFGLETTLGIFFNAFIAFLMCWVFATNEFHKWAHAPRPGALVAWLQRMHLILPPAHHAIHHEAPFNRYYCITVGWMNRPLNAVRFFPTLERWITALTGMIPREDDLGKTTALGVLSKMERQLARPSESDDRGIFPLLR